MEGTISYYKRVIKEAVKAVAVAESAKTAYEHDCELAKNALEMEIMGQQGFENRLNELAEERDGKIEYALNQIDKVAEEYSEEMQKLGRMDGSQIDDDALKLLSSGIRLSNEEWQALANQFKDNFTMTRVLREKYSSNPPEEKGPGLTIVRFGQSPAERAEIFNKYASSIRNWCAHDSFPSLSSGRRFKSWESFCNHLAKESIGKMQEFGEDDFSSVDTDFNVEYEATQGYNVF